MTTLPRVIAVLALCIFSFIPSAWAKDLKIPACGALAEWAETINAEDRWQPIAANKRIWLPRAMSESSFADLFGKSALEWTQADVASARTAWGSCIQLAKKARDNERRSLLQDTRRYLTSNLRNLARHQEKHDVQSSNGQQQARQMQQKAERRSSLAQRSSEPNGEFSHPGLRAGIDEMLKVPPSLEALISLGSLSRLDVSDQEAMEALEKQFGYSTGAAGKAAYRVMRELRIRGVTGYEAQELPRINNRLEAVKPVAFEEFKRDFSEVPTDPYAKRSLEQRYKKVMQQLERALPAGEYQALAEATRQERLAVVDQEVTDAKSSIDRVRSGAEGIAAIDQIVSEVAKKGLNNAQRNNLMNHARTRQRELANQVLIDAAEKELAALPETLAGIREFNAIGKRMLQGVVQHADQKVIQQFVGASDTRLAKIGREALPEYAQALAKLPENEIGLAQVEREVADKEGWLDMEEEVRGDYIAVATSRRDVIAGVVSKMRSQQRAALERERKAAIAAGGDPRLVGTEWVDTNKTMAYEFRDEVTVFINALGIKTAGSYKVSRNDVVVKGPHGQLVFTLEGNRLSGMGLTFIKQSD